MDIYSESKRLLELNKYQVVPSATALDQFRFEDDSLMGMVWVVSSPLEIIENWKMKQDFFLKDNAVQFRKAENKSWNIYVVLLAEAAPDSSQRLKLVAIEEDFRSARKIAQADLRTRQDLQRALYPLLPIQNFVSSDEENRTHSLMEARIKQAGLQSSAKIVLETEFTEESLARFIATHETEKD